MMDEWTEGSIEDFVVAMAERLSAANKFCGRTDGRAQSGFEIDGKRYKITIEEDHDND